MKPWWRRWGWPVAKALLALAILFFIGRQFAINLGELKDRPFVFRPGWAILSCVLYLGGLGTCALFWFHLLRVFGQRPRLLTTFRAYYLGHLGKYVPGKAWALLMRGNMVRGPQVRMSVAIITSFYEVLTTMASGALLAAVLFAIEPLAAVLFGVEPLRLLADQFLLPALTLASGALLAAVLLVIELLTAVLFAFAPPRLLDDQFLHPALLGLLLLALVGVPLLPVVFNTLVRRLAARYQAVGDLELPKLNTFLLLRGLALTGVGWVLLGLSLWAMIQALPPDTQAGIADLHELTPALLARLVATMGLSYVAGFLAFMMPSGVGVREGVMEGLLAVEMVGGKPMATLVVVALRLAWTCAELVMAAVMFFLGRPRNHK